MLNWNQIQANAYAFAKKWQTASNEEADAQGFVTAFLAVFGVDDPRAVGAFERRVALDDGRSGYFDYLWPGRIAIEMKSAGKDLAAAYAQLSNYTLHLAPEDMPELLMVSDFRRIELRHRTSGQCTRFNTANLPRYVRHFARLAGYEPSRERAEEISVNVRAAEKIARLHDALKAGGYDGHALEVYLVRLVFCFFAEDTEIFPAGSFQSLIENAQKDGADLSGRLAYLFQFLNTASEKRGKNELLPPWISPEFQYINGGLFADLLPMPLFNAPMRQALLDCCDFDWSAISPAIFGAMFQGVMDAKARRELGAHYTSEENILKVIRPLFLDALWAEFERVRTSEKALAAFHDKIARLRFLDPACGCGNFLIVAYRELRVLELEILKMLFSGQRVLDIHSQLKVSVAQFAGMEIEDFPCQIARVGMWLMDHLMNLKAAEEFGQYYARLPLTESANIVHGNALETDWNTVTPKNELSYIFGNPPFVGYSLQSKEQKAEMLAIYADEQGKPYRNAGKIDYVAAWYFKAAQMMQGTNIRAALVSTNSIAQGEQPAAIWQPLFKRFGAHIDFAHRTFRWDNEARGKAHVHCVIIGFSTADNDTPKLIFDGDERREANNINPYLLDAPDVFIGNRSKPLCHVPPMVYGNKPTDGGFLFLTPDEYGQLMQQEPEAAKYVKQIYGASEYINNTKRYCLWLVGASPAVLRQSAFIRERVKQVQEFRQKSTKAATRASAKTPMLFQEVRHPETDYIIVPCHSSETREYVPFGFVSPEIIASNAVLIIPDATPYHFGVLTSSVHMAWMRAVCGRLEMRYRYSADIVYNNFPWPQTDEAHRAAIEKTAQAILDARARFPEASLADLYDELTMPPELRRAHQANDRAVLAAYGIKPDTPEPEIVAELMARYRALAGG